MSGNTEPNSNLIINYLPQFLTDEEFKNMFLSIGPLKSTKIVRDKSNGFSFGFGFADFVSVTDAERAVKVFDFLPMYGKRVRVQFADKNDELAKGYNIYVKNIPSTYTETDLDELFKPYGKIVTSKVLMDLQTGQSKNVGFVLYDSKEEAEKAINEMNGKKCPGSTNFLVVRYADDPASKKNVKNLALPVLGHVPPPIPAIPISPSNSFTSPTGHVGPVRNQPTSRIRFNPMAREDKGSVYNTIAQQANYNTDSYRYDMTSPSQGGYASGYSSPDTSMHAPGTLPDVSGGPGPISIFVHNIAEDTEERDLWAMFAPYGSVLKCTVMMDLERKVCKGFGFVDMGNFTEAGNAIQCLNGHFFKGRKLNVSFKKKSS
ncbi:ELAV-like protein 1-B [Mya arenaria]|uniref:ELAV-like protein 1-B n=1 Tax=Mya arenaria TaxID=6604 RepID=UPI0022E6D252|nr:ELAV-like protein 1-B [Mya arenaria]